MNSYRKVAIIVGALFITAMVTSVVGSFVLLDPILNAPDYLINASANETQVIIGALLELINHAAVVGIAVMMFPIFKQYKESIALGYVGARVIECAMGIVMVIVTLSQLILSREYVNAGAPDASYFQTLGALLLELHYWAVWQMFAFAFGFGALLFYSLLYTSKLIPRFISVWGLIGAILVLIGAMSDLFGGKVGVILALPIALNEMFLAVWLIVKGFNPSALASPSAKAGINKIK